MSPGSGRWGVVLRTSAAQFIGVLGEEVLFATALPMWAYDRTGSASSVGWALSAVIAAALFSLPAGAWASRHSSRSVLLGCGALRLAGVLALWLTPSAPFGYILAGAFAIALVDAFFMPTLKAALPDWLPADELMRANSLIESTDIPAALLGPPLAVLFYARWGLAGALGAQAATYGAAWFILLRTSFPAHPRPTGDDAQPLGERLGFTLGHAWASPLVRANLVAWTAGMIAGGIADALILPFVRQVLRQPEAVFGLFGALAGAGMAFGAALTAVVDPDILPKGALLALASGVVTAAFAAFAHGSTVAGCGAAFVAVGAGMVWVHITADTLLQGGMHEDARGGALGLIHTIQAAGLLVGLAVGASGAARWGIRPTLNIAVALLIFATVVSAWAAYRDRRGV